MNTEWTQEASSTVGSVVIDMVDVRQSDGFTALATHGNGVYTTYITTIPTGAETSVEQPASFEISSSYPTPFSDATTIEYELPRTGSLTASVFDVRGRKIATLFDGMQQAGAQQLRWNASTAAPGVYFVRIDFEGVSRTQKVVLQR
jgi:hypothetical protein